MEMGYEPRPLEGDLKLLGELLGRPVTQAELVERAANDPEYLERLVDVPTVQQFLRSAQPHALTLISPWFLFALYLRLARRDLAGSSPIPEWSGPREVVPVFDAPVARRALDDAGLRAQLERLLTRYTHVTDGDFFTWEGGRFRRRRFHDLDPDSLARLLPYAEGEVAGDLLRRMGDAYLFLAGVFPDYVVRRLQPSLMEWERRGQGLYRSAAAAYEDRAPAWSRTLEHLAEDFHAARRALNYVMQRYLDQARVAWFPATGQSRSGAA
jgi:hypothetical protein